MNSPHNHPHKPGQSPASPTQAPRTIRQPFEVAVRPPAAAPAPPVAPASEHVFLSPRVVDRKAYGELAGELRGLIDRASDERSVLVDALDQAQSTARSVRESESAQQANLTLAAKALKGLDDRIAKAAKLLENAERIIERADSLDTRADDIIRGKVVALEARLDSAQAAAAARIEALEQRLQASTREFEQRVDNLRRDADQVITPNISALNEACNRATGIIGRAASGAAIDTPGSLTDLVRRGETINASAENALRRLEEVQTIAATSRNAMTGMLDELASLLGRVDAQRETLGVEADRVRIAVKESGASIDARLREAERLSKLVDENAGTLNKTITKDLEDFRVRVITQTEELQTDVLDRIMRTRKETLGQAQQLLHDVLDQIATVKEQADTATERWRSDLHAELSKVARSTRDQVIIEIKPLVEATGAEVREGITRAEQVQATVSSSSSHLETLVRQVTDLQSSTSVMLRLVKSSNSAVDATLKTLEPWKDVLTGSKTEAEIPEPIRRLIESVRAELQQDLTGIAAALRAAAANADRAHASASCATQRELDIIARDSAAIYAGIRTTE
jgi:hypothetical protein